MMYGSSDMECNGQNFFVILDHFCPFTSLTTWKIKIWKSEKKTPRDIIILHMCTLNDTHMMYGSWHIECDRKFFVILDHFFSFFYPPNNPKNKNFEKMKITPRDIIILHKCTINGNHMMYGSWHMKHNRQNFLTFWTVFCCFTPPPNNPKNQNSEKLKKKTPADIIMLHKCTKTHDHMLYCSWDMMHDRCNFSFWAIFCPFTTAQKIKIKKKKKWKKHLKISSCYTSVPKIMIICYTVLHMWHVTNVIVIFNFVLFFALLPPNSPKNHNFEKVKKTPGDIIILHKCTKNHDHMLYCSWDMACDRCNCCF